MDLSLLAHFVRFNLVGQTQVFAKSLATIQRVAACHLPVLVLGETGTGKENAARAIHYLGERAERAFVPVNCGSLADDLVESELFGHKKGAFTDAKSDLPGLVEIADGGTLFLDEVDSLSLKAQTSLLRFLQNQEFRSVGGRSVHKVDVRVIAASNANFEQIIAQKIFRQDLFYRLNVLNVVMPPLRERAEDISLISHSILKKFSQQYGGKEKKMSPQFVEFLVNQSWPGNVRELENFLLREVVHSDWDSLDLSTGRTDIFVAHEFASADTEDFPSCDFRATKAKVIKAFESQYLYDLMRKTSGNISEASRLSGKERREIGKLLKKYNIDRENFIHAKPPMPDYGKTLG